MEHDAFSAGWYSVFLDPIPEEHTASEVAFIERHLPPREFPTLLDVACGPGRHDEILTRKGFQVTGIDKNKASIESARRKAIPGATFKELDMRDLSQLDTIFDGVVNLWHSFGYYDPATNESIVRSIASVLRPLGRVVFDIYNRDHLRSLPNYEKHECDGVALETRRIWEGKRMQCQIGYADGSSDVFEWQLFNPEGFAEMVERNGFVEVLRCAWFNESMEPSAEHARMQFVFERRQERPAS